MSAWLVLPLLGCCPKYLLTALLPNPIAEATRSDRWQVGVHEA